jgi:hypothetical protein
MRERAARRISSVRCESRETSDVGTSASDMSAQPQKKILGWGEGEGQERERKRERERRLGTGGTVMAHESSHWSLVG